VQRWFSKRTSSQPAPDPAAKKRLLVLSVLGLAVAGLAWWTMLPPPAPAPVVSQAPAPPATIAVPSPVVEPIPIAVTPAPVSPVPSPPPVLVDPFQAYQQMAGRGEAGPAAVPAPPVQPALLPPPPPPPPAPIPAAPAPPAPPAPPTLAEWIRTAGWSVEAIGVGAQANVLLRLGEHTGLYRTGEIVNNSVRILRIEPDRVVLARGAERAVLEVR
jgi:hypothetical protein